MRMRCKEMSIDSPLQRMHILEIFPFRGKFSRDETRLYDTFGKFKGHNSSFYHLGNMENDISSYKHGK